MKLTDRKECTDWFRDSKYGVFFHYLFSMDEMKNFDADGFAKDINEKRKIEMWEEINEYSAKFYTNWNK